MRKLLSIFSLSAFLVLASLIPSIQAADYTDLEQVLQTFADSRTTRDLKVFGSDQARADFTNTLYKQVYNDVDSAVIQSLSQRPEYSGKRMITHDFRTPDAKGFSVNTDRDIRVLVEVEPDRWQEVPTRKWADRYYREFAKRTGYKADSNISMEAHAAKYRQMPTDKFHMEASPDYSDQVMARSGKKAPLRVKLNPDGSNVVESCPNIVRVKKGEGILASPEGLAKMYLQKSMGEIAQANHYENLLLKDAQLPKQQQLTAPERARLASLKDMHIAEALVQQGKGLGTLESVRASYQKQGYNVGKLPQNLEHVTGMIKSVNGTSRTDVNAMLRNLQEYGYRDPTDLAMQMEAQMESLKLANRPQPKPRITLKNAGVIARWAGNIMTAEHRLKEAQQGSHLIGVLNADKADSEAAALTKKAAVVAIELIPIPFIDAMERGWRVDARAKKMIEEAVKRGDTSYALHPAVVSLAVTSTVVAEAVSSMTIDPLIAGKDAVKEAALLGDTVLNNFLDSFSHAETKRLHQQMKTAAFERSDKFGLSGLMSYLGPLSANSPLVREVNVGETIAFSALRSDQWTDDYLTSWYVIRPDKEREELVVDKSAGLADANGVEFTVAQGWLPGEYRVLLQVFDRSSGLKVDQVDAPFVVSGQIGIGSITTSLQNFVANGGTRLKDENKKASIGEILAFEAIRIGNWDDSLEVQWSLDGDNYKTVSGSDPKAHLLRFDSAGMDAATYKVSVRLINTSGNARKIVAYQEDIIRLVKQTPVMEQFKINAWLDNYNGTPLTAPVQNGDILAFEAELKHPAGTPEPAQLVWQVFDKAGSPITGLYKEEQIQEQGISKQYRFRIQLDSLVNGEYTLALSHTFKADPENIIQARYNFSVSQSVNLEKLLVTDRSEDQNHKPVLMPETDPLLYAHYSLGPDVGNATITLTAKTADGTVIETETVERPRPGEQPPYRVGLQVPYIKVPANKEITFEATIAAANGKQQQNKITFRCEPYRLELVLGDKLTSGKVSNFTIKTPQAFKQPLQVDVTIDGQGFSVGHQPGRLSGTVSGYSQRNATGVFKASVVDSEGRSATVTKTVTLQPDYSRVQAVTPSVASTPPPVVTQQPVVQSQPQPALPSVNYTAIGKQRWQNITINIIKAIPYCVESMQPGYTENVRRQMSSTKIDYDKLGRLDPMGLYNYTKYTEKNVGGQIYKSIMQADLSGSCIDSWISQLLSNGLITYADSEAYRKKNAPKTIYWAVCTFTHNLRGDIPNDPPTCTVMTGKTPPSTGYFNQVAVPANVRCSSNTSIYTPRYRTVIKAHGTLDINLAQRIASSRARGYESYFAGSVSDSCGFIGPARLLVSYGDGVEAEMAK